MSGAAAAAAAAAEHRRRMQEEEERMTGYNTNELDGWEFKILRANVRKFKNPQVIRQVCDEEAKAGWEMVEKFDDYRIRFKRRTDKRANDQYLGSDPYRTQVGVSEGQIVAIVLGILAVAGGIAALIILGIRH
jgi:hypothetical protein